jgi:hypothetical protein
MTDIYRDTDERYQRDPAFYSAVRTMEAIAREHGFTPGELKQIAFKAALNLEEKRDGQIYTVTGNRLCDRCRSPVDPLGGWMIQKRRFCSRHCYVEAGGGP